ncbi:MAG: hypothetical protein IJZ07_03880 [Clostridia bacterium]|nr:hypothetical protein [Clostridia bacterium]
MEYRAVAVVDGTFFKELIEYKSIMEQLDDRFKEIQFIHKDNLEQAKGSGEFLSAPLAFFLYGSLEKSEFNNALEFAKNFKKEYEVNNCIVVFPAPADNVYTEEIINTEDISFERFDFVQTIHLIHESYSPDEEIALKLLSLISGFISACPDENNIAFGRSYITAKIELNYDNYIASVILSFGAIKDEVDSINEEIREINEKLDSIKSMKKKKYECKFSSSELSYKPTDAKEVPKKPEQMLDFCKQLSSKASKDYEAFSEQSDSDVVKAQHTLSDTFSLYFTKERIDPNIVTESDFANDEVIPEPPHTVERTTEVSVPGSSMFSRLIPLYRSACENPEATAKEKLRVFLIALGAILPAAGICLIHLVKSLSASLSIRQYIIAILILIAVICVSFLISILIEYLHKNKLRNYMKKAAQRHALFCEDSSKSVTAIRKYINKYVTVAINSFMKTKRLDFYSSQIVELKKRKSELSQKADKIRQSETVFEKSKKEDFSDKDKYNDASDLLSYVSAHRNTLNTSNVPAPAIENSIWIESVSFEIVVS